MSTHVTNHVPEVPGIDLSFRPRRYFGPVPLEVHLLSRVAGQERREALRRELAAGSKDLPEELASCLLDEEDRAALGRIHPAFMGGEYLPSLDGDEVEIARISLASVTGDQISIRAKRLGSEIAYRIVGEYPNGGPQYECLPDRSQPPLTLAELVSMIDSSIAGGGAAMSHLIWNVECDAWSANEYRNFVRVSSEFYAQLEEYYDDRIETWFAEN